MATEIDYEHIIELDGSKRICDVYTMIDGVKYAFEVQHSPIDLGSFIQRTRFLHKAMYRPIWLFGNKKFMKTKRIDKGNFFVVTSLFLVKNRMNLPIYLFDFEFDEILQLKLGDYKVRKGSRKKTKKSHFLDCDKLIQINFLVMQLFTRIKKNG